MKRLVLLVLVMGITASIFAQVTLPEYRFASGNWGFTGQRLYQNDANARLAKVNFAVPQRGTMVYEFNAKYEGGGEDGHGGFGIHLFMDTAYNAESWGAGRSYLLWLNYDENPVGRDIPRYLSAQVYRSLNNSEMELVQSISLNEYLPLLFAGMDYGISFRIMFNSTTGEVRVYDPTDPAMKTYYYFNVDPRGVSAQGGNWVALRTNGVKISFGLGL